MVSSEFNQPNPIIFQLELSESFLTAWETFPDLDSFQALEQWFRKYRSLPWQRVDTFYKSRFFKSRHSLKHFSQRRKDEDYRLQNWLLSSSWVNSEGCSLMIFRYFLHCRSCSLSRVEEFQFSWLNIGSCDDKLNQLNLRFWLSILVTLFTKSILKRLKRIFQNIRNYWNLKMLNLNFDHR